MASKNLLRMMMIYATMLGATNESKHSEWDEQYGEIKIKRPIKKIPLKQGQFIFRLVEGRLAKTDEVSYKKGDKGVILARNLRNALKKVQKLVNNYEKVKTTES